MVMINNDDVDDNKRGAVKVEEKEPGEKRRAAVAPPTRVSW